MVSALGVWCLLTDWLITTYNRKPHNLKKKTIILLRERALHRMTFEWVPYSVLFVRLKIKLLTIPSKYRNPFSRHDVILEFGERWRSIHCVLSSTDYCSVCILWDKVSSRFLNSVILFSDKLSNENYLNKKIFSSNWTWLYFLVI